MSVAYVLYSKHLGNVRQLKALAENYPGVKKVVILHCDVKTRSPLFRNICCLIIKIKNSFPFNPKQLMLLDSLILKGDIVSPKDIDYVFAKTAAFEIPLAILVSGTKARGVYIGEPTRNFFDKKIQIISTPSTPAINPNIFLEVLPSEITYLKYYEKKINNTKKNTTWSIFLGGDTKGYSYDAESINIFLESIRSLVSKLNVDLLIITSPRTGEKIESLLEKFFLLNKDMSSKLFLWGGGDEGNTFKFFLESDLVFVSEDSVSMVSEAINTRLPVIALRPSEKVGFNSLVTPFIDFHVAAFHIKRVSFQGLKYLDVDGWINHDFKPVERCWTDSLCAEIKR